LSKSCLRCANYLSCNDKRKSASFRCERFKNYKAADSLIDLFSLKLVPDEKDLKGKPKGVELEREKEIEEFAADEVDLDEDNKKSLFVYEAMRKARDPLTNTIQDVSIDLSDLKLAANFYEFCKETVGSKVKMPFARQLWIAYRFFGEYCPRCSDPEYNDITAIEVDAEPEEVLEHVTLLRHGQCPSCGATKSKLVLNEEINDYNEIVMVLGQRSGKSTIASMKSAYHVHRLLKIPRLASICDGIQDFTPVQGTFVGLTFARAMKNLYTPFSEIILRSEWYDQYHQALKHYGNVLGKELYRQSTQFLRYNHLNLEFYPMGPLKRTLRGDTRCIASIDELGHFPFDVNKTDSDDDEDDERERANADEVHISLSNSLATIRVEVWNLYKKGINHVPQGLMLNMSSPSSWKDKICRLFKESQTTGQTTMLGLRMPTWDINPMYQRDSPFIQNMYRRNPIKADRDFGANPPSLSSSIYSKGMVQSLFSGFQHHTVAPQYHDSVIPGEEKRIFGKLVTKRERANWPPSILALDAGHVNNSFALALMYVAGEGLVVPSVMEVMPIGGRKIDFPKIMEQVIYPLIEQCNVHFVVADRWNSILLLQKITEKHPDVMSQQYTLKPKDFKTFDSDFVHTGNLVLPSLELPIERIEVVQNYRKELNGSPASHLYLQFLTVREIQGIITKGDGFTDDLYRTVVLGASRVRDKKISEHISKFQPKDRKELDFSDKIIVSGRSGFDFDHATGQIIVR
jgi:hypothetical protein